MWMLTTWLIFVFCIQSSAAYIKLRATSIRVNVGRSLFICLVYRVGRFIHTMVHSFTHLFIPSFIHWDIYSQCMRKTHRQQTVVWVTLSQNRIPVFEVVTLMNRVWIGQNCSELVEIEVKGSIHEWGHHIWECTPSYLYSMDIMKPLWQMDVKNLIISFFVIWNHCLFCWNLQRIVKNAKKL